MFYGNKVIFNYKKIWRSIIIDFKIIISNLIILISPPCLIICNYCIKQGKSQVPDCNSLAMINEVLKST